MSFNYSLIIDDGLSPDDPLFWSRPTPVDCNTIRIIGIFLCLAAFVGIVLNASLLYSFVRYKTLRSPPNIFIMFIVAIGLVASCTILPLTGSSSIYCQWLYHRTGCQLGAVLAFLYGCSSSYLLCGASMSRCYIMVRPFQARRVTTRSCVITSCIALLIAFIWTMLPLMGWNEYTMEGARTSCCINWYDRRISYMTYLLFLFIVVYCVPLAILVTTNGITLHKLKSMRKKLEQGVEIAFSRKRIEMERRILKSIISTTCGFVFTWTPYAVTFFISAFRGKDYAIPPLATFLCACFAKTSVIWIPMFYVITSTHYKFEFISQEGIQQLNSNARVDIALNASLAPTNKDGNDTPVK